MRGTGHQCSYALSRCDPCHAPPDLIALLQTWHSAGRQLHLTLLPIIRTADAALMARLQQNRRLQPWLGEVLNPTTAVWHGVADALVAALRDQGFYPEETTWAQAAAPGVEENATAASLPGDTGVLWLAARTY